MNVKEIAAIIEKIAPLELAQDWDNVGLLIGDAQQDVKKILLTIDVTGKVVTEAKRLKTDLIISYHPVIWDGLKKITAEGSSVVYDLIRSGIAVFSIHTASAESTTALPRLSASSTASQSVITLDIRQEITTNLLSLSPSNRWRKFQTPCLLPGQER